MEPHGTVALVSGGTTPCPIGDAPRVRAATGLLHGRLVFQAARGCCPPPPLPPSRLFSGRAPARSLASGPAEAAQQVANEYLLNY